MEAPATSLGCTLCQQLINLTEQAGDYPLVSDPNPFIDDRLAIGGGEDHVDHRALQSSRPVREDLPAHVGHLLAAYALRRSGSRQDLAIARIDQSDLSRSRLVLE